MTLILLLLGTSLGAAEYQRSAINLPSSTTAFRTTYDLDEDGLSDPVALFQRRILIFFQSAGGEIPSIPNVEIGSGQPIPQEYAGVAIGKVTDDPGLQLLLIGKSGVDYITVAQLKGIGGEPVEPKPLLTDAFSISSESHLQFLDCVLDLDGDQIGEIVLPADDQLEIYSRRAGGKYSKAESLNLPLRVAQRTSFESEPPLLGSNVFDSDGALIDQVRVLPRLGGKWHAARFSLESVSDPLLFIDFNQDRRLDLLLPQRILLQEQGRRFANRASNYFQRMVQATVVQQGRLETVPNLVDFNGDGLIDTFRVEASTARLSPRTDLSVYLGRSDFSLSEAPDSVLRTRDFAHSEVVPLGDVNRDGALDIALFHLDFQPSSAGSQFRAYLKSGLEGDLRFYLWDKKQNRFPDSHSFSHPVVVNYDIYGARQLLRQQVAIHEDMDGDGAPDLVLKTGPTEVSVFRNDVASRKRFDAKAVAQIQTAPVRFSSVQAQNLNQDKLGDLIVAGYLDGSDDRVIYTFFITKP